MFICTGTGIIQEEMTAHKEKSNNCYISHPNPKKSSKFLFSDAYSGFVVDYLFYIHRWYYLSIFAKSANHCIWTYCWNNSWYYYSCCPGFAYSHNCDFLACLQI